MQEKDNKKKQLERIEALKKSLNSKNFEEKDVEIKLPGQEHKLDVKNDWKEDIIQEKVINMPKIKKSKKTKDFPIKKVLIGSFVFCLIAFVLAFVKIYIDGVFSPDRVNIVISGPSLVADGEKLNLNVGITNNNNTAIEAMYLIIEYPSGAHKSTENQKQLPREKRLIGGLAPNETVSEKINLMLLGEQNVEKELKFILEFKFKDSNALLKKEEVHRIRTTSSPITLLLNTPDKLTIGQETTLVFEIISNSKQTIEDLLFEVVHPAGFNFTGSSISPLFGDNVWEIGVLEPGASKVIHITGTIEGRHEEERVFSAFVGKRDGVNKETINAVYSSTTKEVVFVRPFLALDITIDNKRLQEYVFGAEKMIRVNVFWENTLPVDIINGEIRIKLIGEVLDKKSVSVGNGGFFSSIDNTITWDKNSTPMLSVMESGEKGNISFSVKALPLNTRGTKPLFNPQIIIDINSEARVVSGGGVAKKLNASTQRVIKFESKIHTTPRIVHFIGPYTNTGPVPPRVEQETTYTVILTVSNSSNRIKGAEVKTTLPVYVRWIGALGQSENISFDEENREVVWNLGELNTGVGITRQAREVAFQIGFLPSISQLRKAPKLTGNIIFSGDDMFTETTIQNILPPMTTNLSTDPRAPAVNSFVQP